MASALARRASLRVLIADDHRMFRESLRTLLEMEDDLSVVGEAGDGDGAVKLTRELRPDILLLDLSMPTMSGLEALKELTRASADTCIILLTAAIEKDQMVEAFQLGARGLVLKDSATALLVEAMRAVMTGQYWVGRESVSDLLKMLRDNRSAGDAKPRKDFGLTPRELEIISAIVAASGNKEIAQTLGISEKTVKRHLTNIFDKLGVSNRLELALFALRHHLVVDSTNELYGGHAILRDGSE
jgi:two-component system nitrate/nitrite response regulator NarL